MRHPIRAVRHALALLDGLIASIFPSLPYDPFDIFEDDDDEESDDEW